MARTNEDYIGVLTSSETLSDAARELGVSRSRMTNKATELVAKGLIHKAPAYIRVGETAEEKE